LHHITQTSLPTQKKDHVSLHDPHPLSNPPVPVTIMLKRSALLSDYFTAKAPELNEVQLQQISFAI